MGTGMTTKTADPAILDDIQAALLRTDGGFCRVLLDVNLLTQEPFLRVEVQDSPGRRWKQVGPGLMSHGIAEGFEFLARIARHGQNAVEWGETGEGY